MKIRTDFVTNSSSSSFMTYIIRKDKVNDPDMQSYEKLYLLLETLEKNMVKIRFMIHTADITVIRILVDVVLNLKKAESLLPSGLKDLCQKNVKNT